MFHFVLIIIITVSRSRLSAMPRWLHSHFHVDDATQHEINSRFGFDRRICRLAHSTLADEAATKTGDLYIRSVCFSPDGKYLATGAEDKQIRVRNIPPCPQPLCSVLRSLVHATCSCRSGTLRSEKSDTCSRVMHRRSTRSIFRVTGRLSCLVLATRRPAYGTWRLAHARR